MCSLNEQGLGGVALDVVCVLDTLSPVWCMLLR